MDCDRDMLISKARASICDLRLRSLFNAGQLGAALQTPQGNIYTGINIDLGSGLGFCAEVGAIAQMLAHGETVISFIVAVTQSSILAPCGRCRETIIQIDERNAQCIVFLEDEHTTLRELLPHHWLAE